MICTPLKPLYTAMSRDNCLKWCAINKHLVNTHPLYIAIYTPTYIVLQKRSRQTANSTSNDTRLS